MTTLETAAGTVWRHRQEAQLRAFVEAMSSLAGVQDVDEAIRAVEAAAATTFGVPYTTIGLFDPTAEHVTATGPTGERLATETKGSISGWVLRDRRPVLSTDPERDFPATAAVSARYGVMTMIAAPLLIRGRPLGVLVIGGGRGSTFSHDDLALLGLVASAAAPVIENAQLVAEVRRLSEEERRRGERASSRLGAIIDSSADAVIGRTPAGVVTDWNPAAERIYGYTAAEMVGRPLTRLAPPDRAGEVEELLARVHGGDRLQDFETVRLRKDGSLVDVSLSISTIRDGSGAIVGDATIARDVSERVAARHQQADLEARLRQSERLESLGRLVGGIAHDFNNLLAVVLMYADFIEERLPAEDPSRDDLAQIRAAAVRATAFTGQLLTFAKRGNIQPEDLDLGALADGLISMLRRTLPESIRVELRVAPDLWAIHADRGQAEQVILNLVVNAGDAMPTGGTLLLEAGNVDHDVETASQHGDLAPGRYVQLMVSDSGSGMTKEVRERAFEPFFTTKPAGVGTGLGLATVYGIAKQAGGRASIYSEVGRGTCVRVLLPASGEPAPSSVPGAQPPDGAARAGTILVVEDEPLIRAAAQRILASAGYDVLQVGLPDAALEVMNGRDEPVDLLLTDMVMPGMSGRELARRLRARRPSLRVLYMTGYSDELTARSGELEGPLLQKPFTRAPLLAAVAAALGPAP